MGTITREELKTRLDRGDHFKLVNCLDERLFRAKRIPGSIRFLSLDYALKAFDPTEEIIVYCSNFSCSLSALVYHQLADRGYQNLKRYPGGIADWEDAGFPLEGERVGHEFPLPAIQKDGDLKENRSAAEDLSA